MKCQNLLSGKKKEKKRNQNVICFLPNMQGINLNLNALQQIDFIHFKFLSHNIVQQLQEADDKWVLNSFNLVPSF